MQNSTQDLLISLKQDIRNTYKPSEFEHKIMDLYGVAEDMYHKKAFETSSYFLMSLPGHEISDFIEGINVQEDSCDLYLHLSYKKNNPFNSIGLEVSKGKVCIEKKEAYVVHDGPGVPIESAPSYIQREIVKQEKMIRYWFLEQFKQREEILAIFEYVLKADKKLIDFLRFFEKNKGNENPLYSVEAMIFEMFTVFFMIDYGINDPVEIEDLFGTQSVSGIKRTLMNLGKQDAIKYQVADDSSAWLDCLVYPKTNGLLRLIGNVLQLGLNSSEERDQ